MHALLANISLISSSVMAVSWFPPLSATPLRKIEANSSRSCSGVSASSSSSSSLLLNWRKEVSANEIITHIEHCWAHFLSSQKAKRCTHKHFHTPFRPWSPCGPFLAWTERVAKCVPGQMTINKCKKKVHELAMGTSVYHCRVNTSTGEMVQNRSTLTSFCWPMRCARSWACTSIWGFLHARQWKALLFRKKIAKIHQTKFEHETNATMQIANQSLSKMTTVSAVCKFKPRPPARVDRMKTK